MALQQSVLWHVNPQTRKHTDVTTISWSPECMYACVRACVLSVWWLCSKVHRRICAAYCMHKHALTQDLEPVCVVNPSARVRVSLLCHVTNRWPTYTQQTHHMHSRITCLRSDLTDECPTALCRADVADLQLSNIAPRQALPHTLVYWLLKGFAVPLWWPPPRTLCTWWSRCCSWKGTCT